MGLIHDAFRFELDLTVDQRSLAVRSAGTARYAWNWALAERKRRLDEGEGAERFISFEAQSAAWTRDKPAWASEVSREIVTNVLRDLETAVRRFAATRKTGRRVGFPRFKARGKSRDTFKVRGVIRVIDDRHVGVPTFGPVRIKGRTRRMRTIGWEKIHSATISRTADRWFVSLLVDREHEVPVPTSARAVGIDLGLTTSLVLSTGEAIQSPRALNAALRKLRRAQQALSRSQRNSRGREQTRLRVAKVHARVANVRRDWQHRVTDRLTREFAAIGVEDLAVKNLANKKRRNGRAWADLGAAEIVRQITYKAKRRGVTIVVADRFYPSSQLCSGCGHRQSMPLRERTYRCRSCGLVRGRDHNAALNLCPVAVTQTETQNARGGNVSPKPELARVLWQIPVKREPRLTPLDAAA